MEKTAIHFTPTANDYGQVIRAFLTRRPSYWILLGFLAPMLMIFLGKIALDIIHLDFQQIGFSIFVMVMFTLAVCSPLLSAWLTMRRVSKQPQLTLPVTYEFDDEKLYVANPKAEVKYDWSVFGKAFENDRYYFLTYVTNKNAFQYFPKKAFVSSEQEKEVRSVIISRVGQIKHIQKGLTGWKLSLVTLAVLALMLIVLVIVVFAFVFHSHGSPAIYNPA